MPLWTSEEETDQHAAETDEDLPSFLNEAAADGDDLEVLTDGGGDEDG